MAKKRLENKQEIARQFEVKRQQALVREKLFPALVGATTSVDEAKMLTQAITSLIMEEAMKVLKEKKINDIKTSLITKLCEEGRTEEIDALLTTVEDESLFDARMLVEGVKSVIEQLILDEMKSRTLNSFEVDWNRMMQQ